MKTIIPKSWQISGLLDGSITKIIVPMKVQPTIDKMGNLCSGGICYGQTMYGEPQFESLIKWHAPYALDQPLIVRETWFWCDNSEFCEPSYYCYKADSNASAPADWDNLSRDERPEWARWHSPITMPRSAARMTLTPVGVRAVRVDEVVDELFIDVTGVWPEICDVEVFTKDQIDNNHYVFIYDVKTQKI